MNINDLIAIVKKKLTTKIIIEKINIQDKTFVHKNHPSHSEGKFHLKIIINSSELNKLGKIEGNRKIHNVLKEEIKRYIHSLQILIS